MASRVRLCRETLGQASPLSFEHSISEELGDAAGRLRRNDAGNYPPALRHVNWLTGGNVTDDGAGVLLQFTNADGPHVRHCSTFRDAAPILPSAATQ